MIVLNSPNLTAVSGLAILGRQGTVRHFPPGGRDVARWDALYYIFDHFMMGMPAPITQMPRPHATLTGPLPIVPISSCLTSGNQLSMYIRDGLSASEFIEGDLVIGVDEPNSRLRRVDKGGRKSEKLLQRYHLATSPALLWLWAHLSGRIRYPDYVSSCRSWKWSVVSARQQRRPGG